jgi:hypothetical protein
MFCHSQNIEIYADAMDLVFKYNEKTNSRRIFVNNHLENTTIRLYHHRFSRRKMNGTGSGSHSVMGFCKAISSDEPSTFVTIERFLLNLGSLIYSMT